MSEDNRRVKSVSFRVGDPTRYSDKIIEITFRTNHGEILPTEAQVSVDIYDIFNSDNSKSNYILNERTIHYKYLEETEKLSLADRIKKLEKQDTGDYVVLRNNLMREGEFLIIIQGGKEGVTALRCKYNNSINYKPSLEELASTVWEEVVYKKPTYDATISPRFWLDTNENEELDDKENEEQNEQRSD